MSDTKSLTATDKPDTRTKTAELYQVKNWPVFFEGAKSKEYNHKSKCSMPTKHGLGYKYLIKAKNGPALFGAWCAMVQVLSRQEKPRHGYLTDTGRIPEEGGRILNSKDLEILTDIPAKMFDQMLAVCGSEYVNWLGKTDIRIPSIPAVSSQYPLNSNSNSNLNSNSDSNCEKKRDGEEFDLFWQCYPRKEGKQKAKTAWQNAKRPEIQHIVNTVEIYKTSKQWTKEGGQFIPLPATWINQARWEDAGVDLGGLMRPFGTEGLINNMKGECCDKPTGLSWVEFHEKFGYPASHPKGKKA